MAVKSGAMLESILCCLEGRKDGWTDDFSRCTFFNFTGSEFWQPGEGCFLFRQFLAERIGKLSRNALLHRANKLYGFAGFSPAPRKKPQFRKVNQAAYDLDITIKPQK